MADYDRPKAPNLGPMFATAHIVGLRARWIRYDRTRRGWHVVIRWDRKMLPSEVVALQACLGSDPRRETLNLMRVMSEHKPEGRKRWNLLYNRKLK